MPALPNPDPTLPSAPAPLLQDNGFVSGPQLRTNNQAIWGDLQYLLNLIAAIPGPSVLKYERLTTSGIWSFVGAGSPPFALVDGIGGGAGGNSSATTGTVDIGGGGGASGCRKTGIIALSADVNYTIGAGGLGGPVGGSASNGSSSVFGSIIAQGGLAPVTTSVLRIRGGNSIGISGTGIGFCGLNGLVAPVSSGTVGGCGGGIGAGRGGINFGGNGTGENALPNSGGGGGGAGTDGTIRAGGNGGTGYIDIIYLVPGSPTGNPFFEFITTLVVTGTITAGTPFDITASGVNYTFSGAAGNIGASSAEFNQNPKYFIFRGGNNQRKGVLVNWLSATTFSLATDIESGEYLQILS